MHKSLNETLQESPHVLKHLTLTHTHSYSFVGLPSVSVSQMLPSLEGEMKPPSRRQGFTQENEEEKITEDGGMRERRTGCN